MLKESLIAKTNGLANKNQVYLGDGYRITVMSSRLIRFEVDKSNTFTDLPSYAVWNREFDAIKFNVNITSRHIKVDTDDITFVINKKALIPEYVYFKDTGKKGFCKNFGNLKGTRRTLDMTSGEVALDDGLISVDGVYVFDDSKSFLINENGEFQKRSCKGSDLYVFAFEDNYRDAINAFYKISSFTPLVPRYALGVWWSRYKQYTQDEYQNLMLKFKDEDIPITVATVDMDWHWTDLNKQFGTNYKKRMADNVVTGGWTGYSFNTDLFPDYKGFLKFLKDENLHTTLNLHPADGVRFFETQYSEMAKAMGVDEKTKEDIPFICGSSKFWNAYFDVLHKPYEKDGVDFWWIDWQQGKKSDVHGLDPLLPLNHYHYLDNAEDGRISLILSRYSGFGSHRYPLGFSGDTAMNWNVLDFQPYFTITATNSAYTWWSHDIGGHHFGYRDEELYMRWIQFGVFSPIMRLHSTSNDLFGKEPWKYRKDICENTKSWLRLRHKLIPYIYTMDRRTNKDGIALCEPMYYSYPKEKDAYHVKNQYMFGSELMVCPITKKSSNSTMLGSVDAYIPNGRYTDVFTDEVYVGPQNVRLHRELDSIPVLAKEGAIIPMSNDLTNRCDNPKELVILAYAGNSSFTLYEDNSKTDYESHNALTKFDISFNQNTLQFVINKPLGDASVIPDKRDITIYFKDISSLSTINENENIKKTDNKECLTVKVKEFTPQDTVTIKSSDAKFREVENQKDRFLNIFSRWQQNNTFKTFCYKKFKNVNDIDELLSLVDNSLINKDVLSAAKECLLSQKYL